ncbi:MAG: replication factor C large subunit [Candidatus Bathyarchaeia archaeon]
MSDENQPWTKRYSPQDSEGFKGNQRGLSLLRQWIKKWVNGRPKDKAVFLVGPPGTGKTVGVHLLAEEMGYDLMEVNASDYRTKKQMEELIGRTTQQTVSITGKSRMILFDEMEGISGRNDRGGITTINRIIKDTQIPLILVANTVEEDMEDKFRNLARKTKIIEFNPIPFSEVCERLDSIAKKAGANIDDDVIEAIAVKSKGDLRSAINDLEAVARGRERTSLQDIEWLSDRDKQEYIPDVLNRIFGADTIWEARKAINTSLISYDDLYDWISENLPLVLDDTRDLLSGFEALAKADIYQNQARKNQDFRLLKYMFTEMTGGIAMSRRNSKGIGLMKQVTKQILRLGHPQSDYEIRETSEGLTVNPTHYLGRDVWGEANRSFRSMGGKWIKGTGWVIPYYRPPQLKWHYIKTYHDRRKMRKVAQAVADRCHIGTNEAIKEVIPLIKIIVDEDEEMSKDIIYWLDLEEKEVEWLKA